jgi:hypothetical protein
VSYRLTETTDTRTFDIEINGNFLEGRVQTYPDEGLVYRTADSFPEYLTLAQLKYIVEAMEDLSKEVSRQL